VALCVVLWVVLWVIMDREVTAHMPKLTLEVPPDVVDALRLPPEEAEGEIRRAHGHL
jgi:hypothetical protein